MTFLAVAAAAGGDQFAQARVAGAVFDQLMEEHGMLEKRGLISNTEKTEDEQD